MARQKNHSVPAALLVITIISTTLAVVMVGRQPAAVARQAGSVSTDGQPADVVAMPIQIQPGVDGIALIDKKNHTMCIYQYQTHRHAHERLVLLAARSFRYDCLLEDYNTAEPRPAAVQQLLEQDRRLKQPDPPDSSSGSAKDQQGEQPKTNPQKP